MKSNELRSARKKLGLTQQIMALKLGVSQQYLSRLENSRNSIPISIICKVEELGALQPSRVVATNNTPKMEVLDNKEDESFFSSKYVVDSIEDVGDDEKSVTFWPQGETWYKWWWGKVHQRCSKCAKECKQSAQVTLVYCPQYQDREPKNV